MLKYFFSQKKKNYSIHTFFKISITGAVCDFVCFRSIFTFIPQVLSTMTTLFNYCLKKFNETLNIRLSTVQTNNTHIIQYTFMDFIIGQYVVIRTSFK